MKDADPFFVVVVDKRSIRSRIEKELLKGGTLLLFRLFDEDQRLLIVLFLTCHSLN